jgi:hypothetical protein
MNETIKTSQDSIDPEFLNQDSTVSSVVPSSIPADLDILLHQQQEKISILEDLAQKSAVENRLLRFNNKLTNKLLSSSDIQSILRTALEEIGREMNAARGYIYVDISQQYSKSETASTPDDEDQT